ncbi:hypothetical protein DFH11DRAFT_1169320 [Phellopilus nigrolimitatus]|nr:hypothetical protein DFH11DRAFT_1169320 [Phellopilus nigrolimitatus]
MPFSTYLDDPDPPVAHDRGSQSAHHPHSAETGPPHGEHHYTYHDYQQAYQHYTWNDGAMGPSTAAMLKPCTSASAATGSDGYYIYPHTKRPPSSSDGAHGYASKPPAPGPPPSSGLFQMPSFLMGGFSGSLMPGSGAAALPAAMMYDFNSGTGSAYGAGPGKPWRTTKLYTLEETPERNSFTSTPPQASTHEKQAASPFGYIHADPPQEQQLNAPEALASTQQPQQDGMAMDESANVHMSTEEAAQIDEADDLPVIPSQPHQHPLCEPAPSVGLPVYSQSGFDMLAVLGRVATRANPSIALGPVDLTCAFVVSDVRCADAPIVYVSRTFCELTGYAEGEVLGRNCRFLQAPDGLVVRGETRRFTSPEAVGTLRYALQGDRECQVSLVNYRKGGQPFVNRVSIVPVPAEDDVSKIAFHVGFQVDLNEQPGHVMQRIKEGKFYSNGPADGSPLSSIQNLAPVERSAKAMGKALRTMLSDASFQSAIALTTSSNAAHPLAASASAALSSSAAGASTSPASAPASGKPDARDERQWLHLLLLEHAPDFVHVLSLKGHFLYVSPSVRRVLGYEPGELVGKCMSDFCHPSDAVPLLRELKESSLAPGQVTSVENAPPTTGESSDSPSHACYHTKTPAQSLQPGQRIVNLLFRMRTKVGTYTWIECLGQLHVEPGKGRKAIVLSGRTCTMPSLRWGAIARSGGLVGISPTFDGTLAQAEDSESKEDTDAEAGGNEREFWAMLCDGGLFLVAGAGVRDVLGWGTGEMIGRSVREFICDDVPGSASAEQVLEAIERASAGTDNIDTDGTQYLTCQLKNRDGEAVWLQVVLYCSAEGGVVATSGSGRIISQFKLLSSFPNSASSPTTSVPFSFTAYSPHSYPSSAPFTHLHPHQHQHAEYIPPPAPPMHKPPAVPGCILRPPHSNVFAELEATRVSSWQYELQQLKYANRKLREEVDALETRQRLQQCGVRPMDEPM